MAKPRTPRAPIEDVAREWARAQRHKPSRVSALTIFFRSHPDALRFVEVVREERAKGAEVSWDAITARLIAKYGLPKNTKSGTLYHHFRRLDA